MSRNRTDKSALQTDLGLASVIDNGIKSGNRRYIFVGEVLAEYHYNPSNPELYQMVDYNNVNFIQDLAEKTYENIESLITELVRKKRVQKAPAFRVLEAVKLGRKKNREQVIQDFAPISKLTEFPKFYVQAVEERKKAYPTLQDLSEVSGFSRSEWSKTLNSQPGVLLSIRAELEKRLRQAKTKQTKDLWGSALQSYDDRILAATEKRRWRESNRQGFVESASSDDPYREV